MESKDALENHEKNKTKEIQGEEPSSNDLEWIKLGFDLVKQSPNLLNSIAKDLIAINTTLISLYTTALTFLKITGKLNFFLPFWPSLVIVALPIILWLFSILFNVSAYSPRLIEFNEDSPTEIKDHFQTTIREKLKYHNYSKYLFTIAILLASLVIIVGSSLPSIPGRFVIREDYLWVSASIVSIPIILLLFNILSKKDFWSNILENLIHNVAKYMFPITICMSALIIIVGSSLHPTTVEFIISGDHISTFENMSIIVNNQTRTTMPLTLLEESDTSYKVRLDDGKLISFNKNMVEGIKYYDSQLKDCYSCNLICIKYK